MPATLSCLLAAALLMGSYHPSLAAKILLFPFPYYSHVEEMMTVGRGLQEKGHVIHLILSPTMPKVQKYRAEQAVTVLEYRAVQADWYVLMSKESDKEATLEEILNMTPIEDFRVNIEGFGEFCYNALSDQELLARVSSEKYDLAIMDAFPISHCQYILPYKLGIPYISLVAQYEPWRSRTPSLPSFVPFQLHSPPLTPRMNFWERVSNLVTMVDWHANSRMPFMDDQLVAKYAPEKPGVSMDWLVRQSMLWLRTCDFVLDYSRPVMPNEIYIGGITTKPSKELPAEFKDFMESSKEGVILLSFGSFSLFPTKVLQIFQKAFEQLPYKVIWRYPASPPPAVPPHIKLVDWVPQNDLLGHPNMRLFITHAGANSQFEAVYHGVPMLMFPVFADQPSNSLRAQYKGFGLYRSFLNVTTESLVNDIRKIMSDEQIKARVKKASAIFRDKPMHPKDLAVYWVEHVLKYGGEHLRSYAQDMPWYQYLMLDIFACFVTVFLCVIGLLTLMVRVVWRLACRPKEKLE